jgi:hypothetical protein
MTKKMTERKFREWCEGHDMVLDWEDYCPNVYPHSDFACPKCTFGDDTYEDYSQCRGERRCFALRTFVDGIHEHIVSPWFDTEDELREWLSDLQNQREVERTVTRLEKEIVK